MQFTSTQSKFLHFVAVLQQLTDSEFSEVIPVLKTAAGKSLIDRVYDDRVDLPTFRVCVNDLLEQIGIYLISL